VQQGLPHFLILDQEEIRMKFNKGVIIKGKKMNGNNTLVCGWDMQHIVKHEIAKGGGNNGITNTTNMHT
jgi:hypothetical protein